MLLYHETFLDFLQNNDPVTKCLLSPAMIVILSGVLSLGLAFPLYRCGWLFIFLDYGLSTSES